MTLRTGMGIVLDTEAMNMAQTAKRVAVTKQSLIDWQITVDGCPAGWIKKVRHGYEVTFREGTSEPYLFVGSRAFARAKQFAINVA